ncbi:MAG: HsdM family class I SAM-dependent methyltransferase [Candidatus Levyibacteriota bacterium]
MHNNKVANSEVDAYSYIKDQLGIIGWVVKNPARFEKGEVYKQNECLSNLEIKKVLNRDMPEAVVKISETNFWVIESKREKTEAGLSQALKELKEQYATKINSSNSIKCQFISAIAGNDSDGYLISNQYLHDGTWKEILKNGFPKTSLLSRSEIENILAKNVPEIDDRIEFSEQKYLKTAEQINEILHLSAINKSKRARFIAGIVLSFAAGTEVNVEIKDTTILVEAVNSLIKSVLKSKSKEDFYNYICLQLPPNEDNHIKYRNAIVQTYTELKNLDIRSAMNSGNDVLGKFYEVFLKYGNGAKEIGIVLTPRHLTTFAAEVLDIKHSDIVFDPTCGTGGFLVAALDYVKKNSNEEQLTNFKRHNLFGIEQEDDVVALALVNMIFRGDGRNNIKEGNCFNNYLRKTNRDGEVTAEYYNSVEDQSHENYPSVISKVMMNPPFALKKGDEQEYHFIDYALKQMQDGGVLFSVLPISVLVESTTKNWRKNELLKNNTILAVVTFPQDIFYPVGVNIVGLFIKKGRPHQESDKVFFARATTDGFTKKKGKRLFSEKNPNQLEKIKNDLRVFISNPSTEFENKAELVKVCPLDTNDEYVELVPEAYLDSRILTSEELEKGVDVLMRETASFLIKHNINESKYYEDK